MSSESNGLGEDFFVAPNERDPMRSAAQGGRPQLPKRFYKIASTAPVEGGFAIHLDGKPVRTPARKALVAPGQGLAEAIAREWAEQGDFIDPATMLMTRLANSAVDGVAAQMAEVEADAVKYAASDLICYRAGEPETLVAAQAAAWDRYLAFARDRFGARLVLSQGLTFVEQPAAALSAIGAAVRAHVGDDPASPFRLAALHTMTTLTGSCVIALAVALGHVDADTAWADAHVDEDFQMKAWGVDTEAAARREKRFAEMRTAALLSQFVATGA